MSSAIPESNHLGASPCFPLRTLDRSHKIVLATLFFIFMLALLFREHGYSISSWRRYLPAAQIKNETVIGKPRWIRGDDWLQDIPQCLAQRSHNPKFPMTNSKIGFGASMMAPFKIPIMNQVTFYRPSTWGFFLGRDIGLSWMWWSTILGLFYVSYLLFLMLTEGNHGLSLVGGFLVIFSPFFQFWAFHKAEIVIHMGCIVITMIFLLTSKSRAIILGSGVFLGWSVCCFFLHHIYPPFQIVLGYLSVVLTLGLLWIYRREVTLSYRLNWRIAGFAMAAIILGIGGGYFLKDASKAIQLIRATEYPGNRFSLGGGFSLASFLSSHYFLAAIIKQWAPIGNVCESASFFFLSPALILGALFRKEKVDPIAVSLIFFLSASLVFLFIGIPHWLAALTFWSKVPTGRALVGIGMAELFLTIRLLSQMKENRGRKISVLVVAIFVILYLAVGLLIHRKIPELSLPFLLLSAGVNGTLFYFSLCPRRLKPLLVTMLGISFLYTAAFNPVVFGGSRLLFENDLSREISQIDHAHGGNSRWITFAAIDVRDDGEARALSNLFRVLGIQSLDGLHPQPQFEIWKRFDPLGMNRKAYNQVGFVQFSPKSGKTIQLKSDAAILSVFVDPNHAVFRELGGTHFLAVGDNFRIFDESPRLMKIATIKGAGKVKQIYRVN